MSAPLRLAIVLGCFALLLGVGVCTRFLLQKPDLTVAASLAQMHERGLGTVFGTDPWARTWWLGPAATGSSPPWCWASCRWPCRCCSSSR